MVPVSVRPANVAAPPEPVTAVAPVTAGPPPTTEAVTVTPAVATGLPAPSRTCTCGWAASAMPLCDEPDGAVVNVSCAAGPALTTVGAEAVTAARPVALKRSV